MWIDDKILELAAEPVALWVWEPATPAVVLGSSNEAEREANVEACTLGQVPVLRRYGGGGTVLLHPGCVVVSLGIWVRQYFQNKFYFERVNAAVMAALAGAWPVFGSGGGLEGLRQRGLSDLTFGDRKVAGTSLFRSRNYLLYQGSLLVTPDLEQIDRLLRHPSREPDYRAGRGHRSFIAGLADFVPGLSAAVVQLVLARALTSELKLSLGDEMIPPQTDQLPGLADRAAAGRKRELV